MPTCPNTASNLKAGKRTYPATLPEVGFLRLPQIIGNPSAIPPVPALIPVSKSSWWAGVKAGKYPQSIKLGPRTTAWKVEDIRALIESPAKGDARSSVGPKPAGPL